MSFFFWAAGSLSSELALVRSTPAAFTSARSALGPTGCEAAAGGASFGPALGAALGAAVGAAVGAVPGSALGIAGVSGALVGAGGVSTGGVAGPHAPSSAEVSRAASNPNVFS